MNDPPENPAPPTAVPRPVLSARAAAALAEVKRQRPRQRKAAAPIRTGPSTRWGLLLLLTLIGAAAVGVLREKADQNMRQVAEENARVDAMERAYGSVEAGAPAASAPSDPVAALAKTVREAQANPMPAPSANFAENALQPNCRPRSSTAPEARTETALYRWRDGKGAAQFGRHPPPGVDAQRVEIKDRAQAQFRLQVGPGDGVPVPSQMSDRATADTYRIVEILRQELGVPVDANFTLKLSFVASSEAVGAGLGLTQAAGLYLPMQQQMIIWRQPDNERTFATVRHESVHALLHEFIGAPPSWLNEGLAEYLENLRTSGSGGSVVASPYHRRTLATLPNGLAKDAGLLLLDADGRSFHDPLVREQNYALAWAMAYRLMGSESGQRIFKELLAEVRAGGCRRFSSREFFERKYSGGAAAFVRHALSAQAEGGHYY